MPNIKVEPTIPNYPPQGIQAQLDLLYLWNPDAANDLIDQINKALEEVGKDLDNYLTKTEAAATYATQTEVAQLSSALEEVEAKVSSVYRFRGSVATYNDLPTEGNVQGDVWNVEDTGANYAWDGTKWDKLSETIDLTPYLTKEDAASTYATITTVNGKQDALTAEQLAAVNSGITAEHVASYDAYAGEISAAQSTADKADNAAEVAQQTANLAGQEAAQALTQLAGKQATLTEPQLNAVNSGITAAKVASYDAYSGEISAKVNIAQGADNAGKVMTVGADGNLAPADAGSSLPDQTGNAGKFLTTDGTNASWGEIQPAAITTDATLTGTGTTDSPLGVAQSVQDSIDAKLPLAGGEFANGAAISLPGRMRIVHETDPSQYYDITCENATALTFVDNNGYGIEWNMHAIRPLKTKSMDLGGSANYFDVAYIKTINNGADITIPTTGGAVALLSDIPDISNLATTTEVQQEIQDAIGTIETALAGV